MTTLGITLDPLWLFVSLIPSGFGFVLFMYGKKQDRRPQLIGGLLLMAYPYVATTVTSLVVVGLFISAATWWAIRQGW